MKQFSFIFKKYNIKYPQGSDLQNQLLIACSVGDGSAMKIWFMNSEGVTKYKWFYLTDHYVMPFFFKTYQPEKSITSSASDIQTFISLQKDNIMYPNKKTLLSSEPHLLNPHCYLRKTTKKYFSISPI